MDSTSHPPTNSSPDWEKYRAEVTGEGGKETSMYQFWLRTGSARSREGVKGGEGGKNYRNLAW